MQTEKLLTAIDALEALLRPAFEAWGVGYE